MEGAASMKCCSLQTRAFPRGRIAAMILAAVCAGFGHVSLAATDCSATSVAGDWVLQSTNRIAADSSGNGYFFVGGSGVNGVSVFTAVMTLAPDGSALIQERFMKGHRASDIQLFVSEDNHWTLGADCVLEISGVIPTDWGDRPHTFHLTTSTDGLRVEGVRNIEINPAIHKLRYALKGGRL